MEGWGVFFDFFFFSPRKTSSVYVCLCTRNEEWQSTYEATLCSLSLIPIHEEIGVTREDTHTCWTFKFQLPMSEGGWRMRRPSHREASTWRFIYVAATSVLNQAISPQEHTKHQQSHTRYIWEGSLAETWRTACMLMACWHWTGCLTAPVYRVVAYE